MSDRPAYFCIRRLYGREVPEIYWDYLPRTMRGLIYVVRLDLLPGADTLTRATLQQLFSFYQRLKRAGKLPPRWEPPKPGRAEATDG